jgi:uncharacterized protein YcaQ
MSLPLRHAAITISKTTARRYVMGKQGLWPGRRWRGLEGVSQALDSIEALQMDPLNVAARSHDIALWGRVLDYRPEHLYHLLYQERRFFDYGGELYVYPMREFPFWRLHMQRWVGIGRDGHFAAEHPEVVQQVRCALAERGALGNRDFDSNQRLQRFYRGRKDTAYILYYLWLTGEVMIHHRKGFDRYYDLSERILPPEVNYTITEEEAEAHFARKAVSFLGLVRQRPWANTVSGWLNRKLSVTEESNRLDAMLTSGKIAALAVQGSSDIWYALAEDMPLLSELEAGEIPATWQPLVSTLEEAVLLAPLDIISARRRAAWLFDFDYVWEVYKPLEQRRWGYYTIPILYGDRLVGRLDPRLERHTKTLHLMGFWLEDHAPAADPAFAAALGRGLSRFVALVQAERVNIACIQPDDLRAGVAVELKKQYDMGGVDSS